MISFRPSAKFDKKGAIVFVSPEQITKKNFNFNYANLKEEILSLYKSDQFKAEKGESFPLSSKKQVILVVGTGKEKDLNPRAMRILVRRAALSSVFSRVQDVEVVLQDAHECTLKCAVEGVAIGTYKWDKYLAKKTKPKKYALVGKKTASVAQALTTTEGVTLTRNLINDNADVVHSKLLEQTVRQIIRGDKKAKLELLNAKELKAKGLGLHLAVNQGSNKEPKLIIVKYTGASAKSPYTALVGKGITFDTGGLNLKPTGHMETMKFDMGGAGAVVGTLKNIIALKPKKNIILAIGVAENAIDANAYKPGDVIKSYAGKTVEIGNTDAEGRLVLADALAYITKKYQPKRIMDIATLTGACVVALGQDHTGMMSNNQDFADKILASAKATDDAVWQMPCYPELSTYMKSPIADLKNTSNRKGTGGVLTAGEFLRQFVGNTQWAHFDIAGTVYMEREHLYYGFGATGAGVRVLTHYLVNN